MDLHLCDVNSTKMTHIQRYKCIAAINDFLLAFFEIIVLMENVKKSPKKIV